MSVEVDLTEFDRAMRDYAEATGKGIADVVRQQSRLLVRDLIKRTGPDSGSKIAKAIDRDVRRVFVTRAGTPCARNA